MSLNNNLKDKQTNPDKLEDFGFTKVPATKKKDLVKEVFDSVTDRYDVMNDLMSFFLHRYWKKISSFIVNPVSNAKVLDLAGGTGDMTINLSKYIKNGHIVLADINEAMLNKGVSKIVNRGCASSNISYCVTNAENMSFEKNYFDLVVIAFGLRNVTNKSKALEEILHVLKPGGQIAVLEFSKIKNSMANKIYQKFAFSVIPKLGKLVAGDEASYRYLAESIEKHPDQETLSSMMKAAGFNQVSYTNFTFGVVALHRGFKSQL